MAAVTGLMESVFDRHLLDVVVAGVLVNTFLTRFAVVVERLATADGTDANIVVVERLVFVLKVMVDRWCYNILQWFGLTLRLMFFCLVSALVTSGHACTE